MLAWSFEGGEFTPEENSKDYIFTNPKINRYLSVGTHDRNFLLIGPKGIGKTLLIRYKAYKYWKTGQYPSRNRGKSDQNELVENIHLQLGGFTAKDIARFSTASVWRRLWKFSIMYYIAVNFETEVLDKEMLKVIMTKNSIGAIASELLNANNRQHLENIYLNEAIMLDLIQGINYPIALFLDRLDQDLSEFMSSERGNNEKCIELWNSAQIGLAEAIYDINSINSHIKIYATIRSEAFIPEMFDGDLYKNVDNYTTRLSYTKEELREIFIRNILLMPKNELVDTKSDDPIQRMLGFTSMSHRIATDIQGNSRIETAFDFIYRHTFGNPREIVQQGKAIFDLTTKSEYRDKPETEKAEQIREIVNNVAFEQLFRPYIRELIPPFQKSNFEDFCRYFHCNVITEKEIKNDRSFANYLYKIGLLGYVKEEFVSEGPIGKQIFLAAGEHVLVNNPLLPRVRYYITHPAIDRQFLEHIHSRPFYNRFNIIGKDNKFEYLDENQKQPFNPKIFMPTSIVSDQRWEKPMEDFGSSLKECFETYFHQDEKILIEKIDILIQEYDNIMKLIGRLVFLKHLGLSNNGEYRETMDLLSNSGIKQEYAASVVPVHNTKFNDQFSSRILGRYITAGATLFFNLPVQKIHGILNIKNFDLETNATSSDSCLRFLRKCFFLDGLTQNTYQTNSEKNKVFESLSTFGQETLLRVRRDHKQFIQHADFIPKTKKSAAQLYENSIFLPGSY